MKFSHFDQYCFFSFLSAWIKSVDIYDYMQNKDKFCSKNKTKKFRDAIEEANQAISKVQKQSNEKKEADTVASNTSQLHKVTLKSMDIDDLLKTFESNERNLRILFDERRYKLDRFNYGQDYDFLTVLSRIATPEQQKKMWGHISDEFAGKNYIENLKYENLFWKILLPEWLIGICAQKFSLSREQIIHQITKDEQDSFDANYQFDL